ncbi:resolvase, partial [Nocardia sp. 852002-20019_SCH5090214]|uniref:recombinase family protein n=1 Tax=Nocardia sp. 852002-20019_SCH5090214 TaxID=1834087 RepID=UPI00080117AA
MVRINFEMSPQVRSAANHIRIGGAFHPAAPRLVNDKEREFFMASAYLDFDGEHTPDDALTAAESFRGLRVEPGTRAVIYLRVSSPGQVKTDYDPEGQSIPAQRVKCQQKAEQLGLTIVDEYIEPGRTATEMSKRVAFQRLLARVRAERDIDYVIVYKLSRMARNRIDDAIVMADLRKRGVTLISATESIDDTPVGQLMHGILATFNEYQSRESGADIAYKMGQKARNGGTIGRARLGYRNVIDRFDGREIRTIATDPERAPLVQLAFELFATDNYTLDTLSDELYDRGLRTRPTRKHPAKQVSINKLSQMLRDRYYLGYVTYDGEEIKGRHEPLINENLFDRVQDILDARSTAGERRREHPHYLKGSLFCQRCHRTTGSTTRMIIQHTLNRRGTEYTYFFCRNRQDGTCDAPYINVALVEDAVEAHYATVRFSAEFIAEVRAHVTTVINERDAAERLLHKQLTTELQALDTREDNLIELAADATAPQLKIKTKLQEIARDRQRLTQRLTTTTENLSDSAKLIDIALELLENPQQLYRRCNDHQRRMLNQTIFRALYIEDEQIADHRLHEPFNRLHAIQRARGTGHPTASPLTDDGAAKTKNATASHGSDGVGVLLHGIDSAPCSSTPSKVELRGIEPLTFSVTVGWTTSGNCGLS